MQEVADWKALPGNEREFIVLFFDDQLDLGDWVRGWHHLSSALFGPEHVQVLRLTVRGLYNM